MTPAERNAAAMECLSKQDFAGAQKLFFETQERHRYMKHTITLVIFSVLKGLNAEAERQDMPGNSAFHIC